MPSTKYLEDAENLSKMFCRVQKIPNSDEMVVTEAKRKGKELYVDLEPEVRKQKLDSMVSSCFREEAVTLVDTCPKINRLKL